MTLVVALPCPRAPTDRAQGARLIHHQKKRLQRRRRVMH